MRNDNLIAITWIIYISAFLIALWWFWDPYKYVMPVIASAIVSFVGGGFLKLAIQLAFNSDEPASPVKKVIIFFIVIGLVIIFVWSSNGDYYGDLYD
jgi:ABC-type methionine transport system permease subunit